VGYVVVTTTLFVRRYRKSRRAARWWTESVSEEGVTALRSGFSLSRARALIDDQLGAVRRAHTQLGTGDAALLEMAEVELYLIAALLELESGDLTAARLLRDRAGAHPQHRLVDARFALWRGESPGYQRDPHVDALWSLFLRDSNAQVDLLRGERVLEIGLLPTTAARVRARARDDDAAFTLLSKLDERRRDALLRAFPDDPAARVWRDRAHGPYR